MDQELSEKEVREVSEAVDTPNNNKSRKKSKKQKNGNGCLWGIAAMAIMCLLVFGMGILLLAFAMVGAVSEIKKNESNQKLEEVLISGNRSAQNKIAVIEVQGVIQGGRSSFGRVANSNYICEQLRHAANDYSVQAVIIRLNTPGGEVVASDLVYHEIMKLKAKRHIPVIASMDSMAASGGYYIAVACDYIIANRLTLTGSIGVIMHSYEYFQLLQKIGVKENVFKSGAMKDILNGARPSTEAERKIIQNMVNETYNEFVKLVAIGRKGLTVSEIKNTKIGDGRVFSGQQAYKLGLVDQLGYFEDAVKYTANAAGLSSRTFKVIRYKRAFSLASLLNGDGSEARTHLKIEMPGPKNYSVNIERGKMYFLPAQ